jgi:hypothetical protein
VCEIVGLCSRSGRVTCGVGVWCISEAHVSSAASRGDPVAWHCVFCIMGSLVVWVPCGVWVGATPLPRPIEGVTYVTSNPTSGKVVPVSSPVKCA